VSGRPGEASSSSEVQRAPDSLNAHLSEHVGVNQMCSCTFHLHPSHAENRRSARQRHQSAHGRSLKPWLKATKPMLAKILREHGGEYLARYGESRPGGTAESPARAKRHCPVPHRSPRRPALAVHPVRETPLRLSLTPQPKLPPMPRHPNARLAERTAPGAAPRDLLSPGLHPPQRAP
jgi:hypothetical protein